MSVQDYYEDLTIYEEINSPGPFGNNRSYIKTETIQGAVGTLSLKEKSLAETLGIQANFVITSNLPAKLNYAKIIKRERTGDFLRIASNPDIPPAISSFDWYQVYGEFFNMPKGVE